MAFLMHIHRFREQTDIRKVFLANKIKVDETIIRCGQSTLEGGYRETNWLLENAELDAIFVENNLMTLGCVKALSERGVEIPNQIALLGYDDDDWRDTVVIPISSIQPPRYEMGEKATQLLLQKINYPKRRSNYNQTISRINKTKILLIYEGRLFCIKNIIYTLDRS